MGLHSLEQGYLYVFFTLLWYLMCRKNSFCHTPNHHRHSDCLLFESKYFWQWQTVKNKIYVWVSVGIIINNNDSTAKIELWPLQELFASLLPFCNDSISEITSHMVNPSLFWSSYSSSPIRPWNKKSLAFLFPHFHHMACPCLSPKLYYSWNICFLQKFVKFLIKPAFL
jgi:hypothetical protein